MFTRRKQRETLIYAQGYMDGRKTLGALAECQQLLDELDHQWLLRQLDEENYDKEDHR